MARSRALLYKILSECFYPPEAESLKSDFSRLFIGPFKLLAPPYGSIYLDGNSCLMGASTMEVRQLYRNEGLNPVIKEAPDHIAIELEFMYNNPLQ